MQGFPPDFYFVGPFDDKFKQIGNAVSPRFADVIARHIDSEWGREHSAPTDQTGDIVEPIRKSISSALAGIKRRMRQAGTLADVSALVTGSHA